MKKIFCILLTAVLLFCAAGCGASTAAPAESTTEKVAAVDVDLTHLSSTMVYSEVYNMLSAPETYIGKTVMAQGPFAVYQNEETGERFFAVRIEDATACCAQGLEFVWAGEHSYPEDYPAVGTEIRISGTFNTYMDGDQQYCHLENAQMVLGTTE